MPNANLQSTAPLRKKTFYSEGAKKSPNIKNKKSQYGKGTVKSYVSKGGTSVY